MEGHLSKKTSTSWIERLAKEEISMEQSGTVDLANHFDSAKQLEESSIDLMDRIRELFEIYTAKFNEVRSGKNGRMNVIKIFKISETINDFMLFRNSCKMIVARRSSQSITVSFLNSSINSYDSKTEKMKTQVQEIRAMIGPFNNISWTFQGDPIEVEAFVKHYLTDFIKRSLN